MSIKISRQAYLGLSLLVFASLVFGAENQSRIFSFEIEPPAQTDGLKANSNEALAPGKPPLKLIDQNVSNGLPQRQRAPQLSEDQVVVVGLDNKGVEIMRSYMLDPRISRMEVFDEQGKIEESEKSLEAASFNVIFADDPRLASIEIYHPQWNGRKYLLKLLGKSNVNQ